MVANKYTSKIIIAVMSVAVILCFLAIGFSDKLTELLGGTGVTMEYESKLFDTDEIISIDIKMDSDEWNKMLSNALSEEYYACDVVINGKTFKNVAIRPKGNTSLSSIAMDSDTNRYSFKLEFDHFVEGQTCYGLDKLILNNNYADATNMKEALIYDMFQYIGANASLYNYAKISVNGEYWGVYLALEGVEQSFMLRNFGTQDGELYKPDSMEMGGGKSSSSGSSSRSMPSAPDMPDMSNFSFGNMPSGMPDMSNMPDFGSFDPSSMPSGGFGGGMPDMSSMPDMGNMPNFGGNDSGSGSGMPGMSDFSFDSTNMPNGGSGGSGSGFDGNVPSDKGSFSFDPENMPDMGDFKPSGGGFSVGGKGANLNYTDDELDSYSTIWDGSITGTGKSDHRRVITALKNISEGTDLEKYLDVDNILKYMAVHVFSVNQDSLSGSMAHNYYLYEYDGQLNIFPWDYNLSLGGMSMGSSGNATEMVNDAIDTPFSGTKFFDALLSNEEYLERYHAYLRQLVDEYVNGGRFDEAYSRIRSQIDSLVETDPNAFYNYEEYQTAVGLLYETVKLRIKSIEGQLDGTIPSTDTAQRKDSSSFVDASHIDVEAMGKFNMGGGGFGGFGNRTDGDSDEASDSNSTGRSRRGANNPRKGFFAKQAGSDDSENAGSSDRNFSGNERGNSISPENNFSGFPPNGSGERPSFSGMPGQFSGTSQSTQQTLIMYGVLLMVMIALLLVLRKIRRR